MRFRPLHLSCLSLLAFCVAACGDDAPVYPPIVIVEVNGNIGGSGNTGSGNTGNNNTGNENTGNTGGSGTSGGSGNTGGSMATDPLYAHCAPFANALPPPVKTKCDMDMLEDGGPISGDITADKTLTTGHSYLLKGTVRVMPGTKLTIEPCVKIIGEDSKAVLVTRANNQSDATCLYNSPIKGPPGQLIAVGEPMAPIVFTSSKPVGQRKPGDWGGVLLLGNAHNAVAEEGQQVQTEGLTKPECHGYWMNDFDTESSGHLEYVRIEYASRTVDNNNETNGLTLGSLGSGTELHYVMVSNSADDCFEWFGGTVNADHLIALNCDDDMFDNDSGYSGQLQFLFGRQYPTTDEPTSRGLEIDRKGLTTGPSTKVSYSNITLCGGGPTDPKMDRAAVAIGIQDPLGTEPTLMNLLATGFTGPGIELGSGVVPHWSYSTIFGEKVLGAPAAITGFLAGTGDSGEDLDRFCDCWANPPAPIAASIPTGTAPTGFGDASVGYRGAFADTKPESNWMTGLWVDWSSK